MSRRAASWNATASYRLGVYWQGAGDFEHAEAAYQAVLNEIGNHAPTLFNLSVTQIRLGQCERALRTMDKLSGEGIPKARDEANWKKWSAVGCSLAYNRALAHHYLKQNDRAKAWSLNLARRVLSDRDVTHRGVLSGTFRSRLNGSRRSDRAEQQTLERLAWSALMLHASIIAQRLGTSVPEELYDGALRAHSEIAKALDDEIGGIGDELDKEDRDRHRRAHLREALQEASAAKQLEWYVRLKAHEDVRTRYNLACYVARLAKTTTDSEKASQLRQRGIDHVTFALRDRRLRAWADQDPALTPLKRHHQWKALVVGVPADEAAETAPTATRGPADEARAPQDAPPGRIDRRRVVDQASLLLDEARASSRRAVGRGVDQVIGRAETLSDDAFQRELTALLASVHDSMTVYSRERPATAAVPMVLGRCRIGDELRHIVTEVSEEYTADLPPGAQITHWNGVPIGTAVEALTGLIGAATADARSARAVAALTHWPIELLGPPETDVVTLRVRRSGAEREVRLRRSRSMWSRAEGGLMSTDLLADAVRRSRAAVVPRARWDGSRRLSDVLDSRAIPGRPGYGQLRLFSFDVEDPGVFVDEVVHALSRLPEEGLVIDLRGNSGGRIEAAERLLQLFTPRPVAPQRLQARATDVMARAARASDALTAWRGPIESAMRAERGITEPFELASGHTDSCNEVGQIYHGPVELILDSLTGGAADFVIAGFARHRIGSITSVDEPFGNPPRPAEAWTHAFLHDLVRGHPLEPLPESTGLCVPVRRADLDGWGGVEPHHHLRTLGDVVSDDEDLLGEAVARMSVLPVRVLRASLELARRNRITGDVRTRGFARLRILVDDDKREHVMEVDDGKHPVRLDVTERTSHNVELRGEGPDGTLVALGRVTLGAA